MSIREQKVVALIPARGGSKGISDKNIKPFCGKPLIAWTIEQARASAEIDEVIVTSDSPIIISVSEQYGAKAILRPSSISGDTATTESALLHALENLEGEIESIVLLQVTSPLRKVDDIDAALKKFHSADYDSLFSGAVLDDFFIWKKNQNGELESQNYDHQNRGRRQDRHQEYVENGSIYITKPDVLVEKNNRLGTKVAVYLMEFWQSFEIDEPADWDLLEILFTHYLLSKKPSNLFS